LEDGLLKKRTTVIKISCGITPFVGLRITFSGRGLFVRIFWDRSGMDLKNKNVCED